MKLYWLGGLNFGDALTPILFKVMTGKEAELGLEPPRVFCIGSIATMAGTDDVLWGTGVLSPNLHIDENLYILPNGGVRLKAKALAVRGPLTDALLREPCGVYGDPSLLLPKFHQVTIPVHSQPAIVPHYIDKELVTVPAGMTLIDIQANPLVIIKQLAGASWVASSSLHGISVAEAYGVPAVWVEFSDNVAGAGFKFRDYYLGTGREPPLPVDCRSGLDVTTIEKMLSQWTPPVVDPRLLDVCPFMEP